MGHWPTWKDHTRAGCVAQKPMPSWPTMPDRLLDPCWFEGSGQSPWTPNATDWSSGSSTLTWVQTSLQDSSIWFGLCRMEPYLTRGNDIVAHLHTLFSTRLIAFGATHEGSHPCPDPLDVRLWGCQRLSVCWKHWVSSRWVIKSRLRPIERWLRILGGKSKHASTSGAHVSRARITRNGDFRHSSAILFWVGLTSSVTS